MGLLRDLANEIAKKEFGETIEEAQAKKHCISCKQSTADQSKWSEPDKVEYNEKSALCPVCWERFAPPDDGDY